MSGCNTRRAPNVSQYIKELNQMPSLFDIQSGQDDFDFMDSLAMFTSTEFPDFDVGDAGNDSIPFDPALEDHSNKDNTATTGADRLYGFPLFKSKCPRFIRSLCFTSA
jgi:hypothetical protein